jgi:L-rhamnose 1-dehydrogenase
VLLKDKVAIVTGASRGIGRATAVELARHGAKIVINHYDGADERFGGSAAAREALAEVREAKGEAVLVHGDVNLTETAEALVDAAKSNFGGVDIHVSNAGICPFHSFLEMPEAALRRTIDVNLVGAYLTTQAAARAMVTQGRGGAIVAISSISALVGGAMQTHYTPTKAGVLSLMQSVAIAVGPYGIRANAVLPGAILTDINRADLSDEDKLAYFRKRIPLGRIGEPRDIAKCVIFLASDLASYVTGAALLADGGMFVNLQ